MTTRPTAAIDRLSSRYYNEDAYDATENPGGLDESDDGLTAGHVTNFPASLVDLGNAAAYVGDVAGTIAAAQSTIAMVWDAVTTVADPGAGKLRATTSTPAAGSYSLLVSVTDSAGVDVASMLAALGASSSTVKARARLVKVGDASAYLDLQVTGVSGAGAYRTMAVTSIGGPGGFVTGDEVAMGWVRTGDKGDAGGVALPPGSASAPGLAVTGDTNTGLAQVGGADTLSVVAGGAEVIRSAPNVARVYGALTVGDRGDGFGSAITLTPGAGPDWHIYSRVSDGALVVFHYKNRAGANVSVEAMVLKDGGAVDFAVRPTVAGQPISVSFIPAAVSTAYTVVSADAGKLFECSATLTLSLTAAATLGAGFTFAVWSNGAGAVTVDPAGSEVVNGSAAITLAAGDWAIVVCTGSAWKALRYASAAGTGASWSATDKDPSIMLGESNCLATATGSTAYGSLRGVAPMLSKAYREFDIVAVTSPTASPVVGMASVSANITDADFTASSGGYGYQRDGVKKNNAAGSVFGSSYTAGDIIGMAFDASSGKLWFAKNGIWQGGGDPATGASPAYTVSTTLLYYPAAYLDGNSTSTSVRLRPALAYAPPSGYAF